MHFNPARIRRLFREDGSQVFVCPFEFNPSTAPAIEWMYFTVDNRRIVCEDEDAGIFSFVDAGERVYLVPPTWPQ